MGDEILISIKIIETMPEQKYSLAQLAESVDIFSQILRMLEQKIKRQLRQMKMFKRQWKQNLEMKEEP